MEQRPLGRTGIKVSKLCLGTMTWGEQNTPDEAFAQLDLALDRGVNFIDTAEMYPVPPKAETQGRTEEILGEWLAARGRREDLVIASKVAGYAEWLPWVRGGPTLARAQIREAVENSLRRLRTDYIDLYQVHWPDRPTNYFGKRGYHPPEADRGASIEETLAALHELVEEGKIRCIGISNETPWGTAEYLRLSRERGWPRVQSIQNPYNLLNRTFEIGLAEFAHREDTGLLAYSPLGFGVLTGKYLDGAKPAGARLTRWERFGRYQNPQATAATARYVQLARDHGLDPAQMALAFVTQQPFTTANIIGATSLAQLTTNLDSADIDLSEEMRADIETIYTDQPDPAP